MDLHLGVNSFLSMCRHLLVQMANKTGEPASANSTVAYSASIPSPSTRSRSSCWPSSKTMSWSCRRIYSSVFLVSCYACCQPWKIKVLGLEQWSIQFSRRQRRLLELARSLERYGRPFSELLGRACLESSSSTGKYPRMSLLQHVEQRMDKSMYLTTTKSLLMAHLS